MQTINSIRNLMTLAATGTDNGAVAEALPARSAESALPARPDFAGIAAVRDGLDLPTRVRISDEEMRRAREKMAAVRAVVEIRETTGVGWDAAVLRAEAMHGPRLPLLATAGKNGTSWWNRHNVRNAMNQLPERAGKPDWSAVDCLVRNYAMCGRRERAGDARFWQYWQAVYLSRQQVSIAEARYIAAQECRREGITDIPSLAQVVYWRRKHIDPAVETLARFGEEAFRAGYQYFINREWSDVKPGEIWFSDHHDLDCPCRVWDEAKQGWAPCRPTLTAFMDAISGYLVGWQISAGAGNSETIMNTLALGICNAGMTAPAYIYTDNGADYEARGLGTPVMFRGREYSVILSLNIQVIHSLKYRAQAKTIERRFKDICGWFARRWGGYLGNRPGTRSEIANYYWEHPEELPTLEQLCQAFAVFLAEELHTKPSDSKMRRGRSSAEVWAERVAFSAEWTQDDLYHACLLPVGERQAQRGPSIQLDNVRYYSPELMRYVGRQGAEDKLLVYRDRFNPGHVWARTFDDRMIECLTKPAIKALAATPEEREMIGQAEREKRLQLRSAYTALDGLTAGTRKLADPMSRIAALRAGDAARIERAGDRRSVKGGCHNYTHYRLVTASNADGDADEHDWQLTAGDKRETESLELRQDLDAAIKSQIAVRDDDEWSSLLSGAGADCAGDDDASSDLTEALKQKNTGGQGW